METTKVLYYGKLQCPYCINYISSSKENNFEHSTIDIICDPSKRLVCGEFVEGQINVYELLEIIEERPATGDFSCFDFVPVWIRYKCKFIKKIGSE